MEGNPAPFPLGMALQFEIDVQPISSRKLLATRHLRTLAPDLDPGDTLSIEALLDDGREIVAGFAERGLGTEAMAPSPAAAASARSRPLATA